MTLCDFQIILRVKDGNCILESREPERTLQIESTQKIEKIEKFVRCDSHVTDLPFISISYFRSF